MTDKLDTDEGLFNYTVYSNEALDRGRLFYLDTIAAAELLHPEAAAILKKAVLAIETEMERRFLSTIDYI